MLPVEAVERYVRELQEQLATGQAAEHAYRPALQRLMERMGDTVAVQSRRPSHENGHLDGAQGQPLHRPAVEPRRA